MIGFIKKFLNSDFTKPLNTLIDEVKATLALIKAKTDTITANLFTATHASRIDANISSRALETTAQAIKAKTDLLSAGALSGNVKSIQRGQLLSYGTTAGPVNGPVDEKRYRDIAISPVNISKCVIFTEIGFAGDSILASCVARSGSNNESVYRGLAKLTSPTNLRIHSASSSSFVHGSWTVVEYY